MKIKVSEATPIQLNFLVAKCEGYRVEHNYQYTEGRQFNGWWQCGPYHWQSLCGYSTNWSQGGPIIEREGIAIDCLRTCGQIDGWIAATEQLMEDTEDEYSVPIEFHGPTPLIAAMRAYVASKLGDEVEIPEELS